MRTIKERKATEFTVKFYELEEEFFEKSNRIANARFEKRRERRNEYKRINLAFINELKKFLIDTLNENIKNTNDEHLKFISKQIANHDDNEERTYFKDIVQTEDQRADCLKLLEELIMKIEKI